MTVRTADPADLARGQRPVGGAAEDGARRTAGTGIVRVMPTYATGDQSP